LEAKSDAAVTAYALLAIAKVQSGAKKLVT